MIGAVAYDFDGVFVLDSDGLYKPQAWTIALCAYPGYESVFEEAKKMYGSGKRGGRAEIIAHVLKKLGVPQEDFEAKVKEVSKLFDTHVQSEILNAGLVPGALEMLGDVRKRGISQYLNSGTATSALKVYARNLEIDHFFKEILGSTPEPVGGSKVENLKHIAEQENIALSEILMVGDGDSDMLAAFECGCPFLGVANRWNRWAETKKPFPLVRSLSEVSNTF